MDYNVMKCVFERVFNCISCSLTVNEYKSRIHLIQTERVQQGALFWDHTLILTELKRFNCSEHVDFTHRGLRDRTDWYVGGDLRSLS